MENHNHPGGDREEGRGDSELPKIGYCVIW